MNITANIKRHAISCALITAAVISSCSQWRVSSLGGKELFFIKNGTEAGDIAIHFDEFALTDLSFRAGIFNGTLFTVDNVLKRIQAIDSDGSPELVIGSPNNISSKKITAVPFKFGVIGSFTVDRSGNIYVQNRLSEDMGDGDFSPSYVLVFDKNGKLQYAIGQRGSTDTPFYYIDSLFVDERERLFVVSRSFDTWNVYRFDNRKPDFSLNLGSLSFKEKDGDDTFDGQIENVKLYENGDMMLISVAYYHNKRLKYHKVYDYSINKKKLEREIMNIPDPKNVLFDIVDDKHLYFWNTEKDDIRLMICSMEGSIINNIQVTFDSSKYLYSKLQIDSSGRLYSYHVSKKGINILRWE
ncbi:MAG: hypothetical protein LBT84_06590 [Spirochaetia bacterium]|jgi:hypothetical protein|nr:hypothetical protein [Spirochaetia bacterium]